MGAQAAAPRQVTRVFRMRYCGNGEEGVCAAQQRNAAKQRHEKLCLGCGGGKVNEGNVTLLKLKP